MQVPDPGLGPEALAINARLRQRLHHALKALPPSYRIVVFLRDIEGLSTHAQQLSEGLRLSRSSLELIAKELEIALDDPFLETRKKEVDDLAKESAKLAAKGELAVRRADRALAIALGLEPRPDQMFIPTTTG